MTFRAVAKRHPAPGGLELHKKELREVGPHEALVEVAAAGICGTDLEIWNWPTWLSSRMSPRLPVVIGHEFCGHVREVGSDVTSVGVGDYVSAESHISCGRCRTCKTGLAHICENLEYVGVDIDGGFAEYAVLPVSVLRPLPASVPVDSAAMLEPFGLAVRAVLADGGVQGRSVLVTGLGPLGLMTMAAARASGAELVVGIESSSYRLDLAREYAEEIGGPKVLSSDAADNERQLRDWTAGRGVDVWLDYSGAEAALSFGLHGLAVGGQARLMGMAHEPPAFDLSTAIMKEIGIRTFHGRDDSNSWPNAIRLLAERKVDLSRLVTHRLSLGEYNEAFDLLLHGQACKVLVEINP